MTLHAGNTHAGTDYTTPLADAPTPAFQGSSDAYGAATRATATPRTIEYRVFSQVTGALNQAMAPDRPFAEMAAALHRNLMLWTALQGDLLAPDNGLPMQLKRNLLALGQFTRAHTEKALKREADPGVLIEINTAVMKGLRGQPANAAAAPQGHP
ncbi:MAG: flagellar biosynthesis regulator FlaF [Pseudomonadota bacterium]